jgi:hypothetical protein
MRRKEKKINEVHKSTGLGLDLPVEDLLKNRFTVPPFSVLNVMQDYWQRRKADWIRIGIRGELGRGENLLKFSDSVRLNGETYKNNFTTRGRPEETIQEPHYYRNSEKDKQKPDYNPKKAQTFNPNLGSGSWPPKVPKGKSGYAECMKTRIGENYGRQKLSATSIFDPVLCELIYRWFCPIEGSILDPFAGGSVRGVVAAHLDYHYTGIDLSAPQIAANQEQAKDIGTRNKWKTFPAWHVGDSADVKKIAPGKYDLVFSCPPYYDLEVYSDDPKDLSCMSWDGFLQAYQKIIKDCVSMLQQDRFAAWVIGEVRNKDGFYYGLVPETIQAFEAAGAKFYNEFILFTAIGTLPIRTSKQFNSGRKAGKAHQNLLVFYKGDPKKIKSTFKEVD